MDTDEIKKSKTKKVIFISKQTGVEIIKFKIAKDNLSAFKIEVMANMLTKTNDVITVKSEGCVFIIPPGLTKNCVIKIK